LETETFPESILKACDIRGVYPEPLGLDQALQIGQAVGTLVKIEGKGNIKVVVGGDIRESSEDLKEQLLAGLKGCGMKVIDAGLVSTPLLAYATRFTDASVGVMVTASHNPSQYNGFKFFHADGPAPIPWVERLYKVLRAGEFKCGAGVSEKKDFLPDYRTALVRAVASNLRHFSLVAYLGNGAAAVATPSVLEALGCDFHLLHERMDARYPGRGPDSSHPPALRELGEAVKKHKAALGAAFDGDGDRVAFVDDKGIPLPNDAALCIFARHYLAKHMGGKVVYDAKSFDLVEALVAEAGGEAVLERSGHVFIHTRIRDEKAVLGGEASGHFFLPGPYPGDALFACLKFMEILKALGQPLSKIHQTFPPRVSTHDVKVKIDLPNLPALLAALDKRAKDMGGKVSRVDGVRAVFPEGWGIARASVTEPVLSIRIEAVHRRALRKIVSQWFEGQDEPLQALLDRIGQGD